MFHDSCKGSGNIFNPFWEPKYPTDVEIIREITAPVWVLVFDNLKKVTITVVFIRTVVTSRFPCVHVFTHFFPAERVGV